MAENRSKHAKQAMSYMSDYEYDGSAARRVERSYESTIGDNAFGKAGRNPKKGQRAQKARKPISATLLCGLAVCILGIGVGALSQSALLMAVNDQNSALRSTMAELQESEAKLVAQYELSYDIHTLETDLLKSGAMVKAQVGQIYNLDMTQPDSVEYH